MSRERSRSSRSSPPALQNENNENVPNVPSRSTASVRLSASNLAVHSRLSASTLPPRRPSDYVPPHTPPRPLPELPFSDLQNPGRWITVGIVKKWHERRLEWVDAEEQRRVIEIEHKFGRWAPAVKDHGFRIALGYQRDVFCRYRYEVRFVEAAALTSWNQRFQIGRYHYEESSWEKIGIQFKSQL